MYKKTHNSLQGRADRLTIADLQTGGSDLTEQEREAMLKELIKAVDLEIHRLPPKSPDRKMLGRRKMLLQSEMAELRKNRPKYPGLSQIFMEEAKRILPREQFSKIESNAMHIHRLRNKPKANQQMAIEASIVLEKLSRGE